MKVYIAGNPHYNLDRIKAFGAAVREAGHTITYFWPEHFVSAPKTPVLQYLEKRREAAQADLQGVLDADALVLFDSPKGYGMYVELGVALGAGKPAIVIEPGYFQVFYALDHCKVVRSEAEALQRLTEIEFTLPTQGETSVCKTEY